MKNGQSFSKWLVWLVLLFVALTAWASLLKMTDVRLASGTEKTRVVFELNKNTHYHVFSLNSPPRLVIDLPHTKLSTKLGGLDFTNTPIQDLRAAVHKRTGLRLVFDLKNSTHYHSFFLNKSHEGAPRLVVDFNNSTAQTKAVSKQKTSHYFPHKVVSVKRHQEVMPKPVMNVPWSNRARDVIVVIDPGHGGKDPGATGPHGVHEKNVVLAIARKLKAIIDSQPGMRAVLTRKKDYYITLRERLRLARKYKGDMFIAIHADAFHNRHAKGASVFALSERGATSEAARWLAEKENYSELGGVNLSNKSNLLRSVLIDLSQTATIGASLKLGRDVLDELDTIEHLHHRKVEQARFVVLKSPDIPSILIETGFITNPYEERMLNSPYYQRRLAGSILKGVKRYFWQNPPPGTRLALMVRSRKHKVSRGESLSIIAARYHVSVGALKSLNELSSNRLRVGQTLRIPSRS